MGLWAMAAMCSAIQSNGVIAQIASRFDPDVAYMIFMVFRANSVVSDVVNSQIRSFFSKVGIVSFMSKLLIILPLSLLLVIFCSIVPILFISVSKINTTDIVFMGIYFMMEFIVTIFGYIVLGVDGGLPYFGLIVKSVACLVTIRFVPVEWGVAGISGGLTLAGLALLVEQSRKFKLIYNSLMR